MTEQLQHSERQATTQTPPAAEHTKGTSTKGIYCPRVNVVETANELFLSVDLPGVKPEDVSLDFKGEQLILHARCAPRHAGKRLIYAEYGVGDFYRAFRIAEDIETGQIEATMKDGVLTVRLPKAERVRPRRISVTSR